MKKDSVDADSVAFALKQKPWQPNPKKAGLFSSILPGSGQFYNRQYWKVPIVYAIGAVSAHFITKNLNLYLSYRKAYIGRIVNANYVDEYTLLKLDVTQIKQYQDDYKKNLDLTTLLSGVAYALQIMDAVTSAHLKNFDMSRDISMHMLPVVFPNGAGLGLVMNFK